MSQCFNSSYRKPSCLFQDEWKCGLESPLMTLWTDSNPCHHFYGCEMFKVLICLFFFFIFYVFPHFFKSCILFNKPNYMIIRGATIFLVWWINIFKRKGCNLSKIKWRKRKIEFPTKKRKTKGWVTALQHTITSRILLQ